MRVSVVVITHNRAEELTRVLARLRELPEQPPIVVVDNGSTDGSAAMVSAEHPHADLLALPANLGGAGGFAVGIARAVTRYRPDWIWLMDDDAEPRPDALATLLAAPEASDPRTVALCTSVVHPDGTPDVLHRCRYGELITPLPVPYEGHPTVDCASFVGLLVRADAARAAGLPLAQFFLGYDDAEYSLRLWEHGAIRLVPESEILHKVPIGGGGATTRRGRFFNARFGLTYAPVPWEAFWRDLYRVRNFMWIRRDAGPLEFLLLLAGYVAKSLMYDPQPLRRVPWLVRFARKGRRGDWSAPTPEEWAAR